MNFELTFYKTLPDIKAASAIVAKDSKLFIVSDDSDILHVYDQDADELSKISLREDGKFLEHQEKPKKSDFETMTFHDGRFYIFGSGSTSKRNSLVLVSEKNYSVRVERLNELYNKMKLASGISDFDFNIEGSLFFQDHLYLFNRGNGPKRRNGVFIIRNWSSPTKRKIEFNAIDLPQIEGVPYSYTDAILIGNQIYFLAVAEKTSSTYADGVILGSIIGVLDMSLSIHKTRIISNTRKFEGLILISVTKSEKKFLVCEDPDDEETLASIFQLTITEVN